MDYYSLRSACCLIYWYGFGMTLLLVALMILYLSLVVRLIRTFRRIDRALDWQQDTLVYQLKGKEYYAEWKDSR